MVILYLYALRLHVHTVLHTGIPYTHALRVSYTARRSAEIYAPGTNEDRSKMAIQLQDFKLPEQDTRLVLFGSTVFKLKYKMGSVSEHRKHAWLPQMTTGSGCVYQQT